MKIISEASKEIIKVLGTQKIKGGVRYRPIAFIVEEETLVCNTLTGEMLELDSDEYGQFAAVKTAPVTGQETTPAQSEPPSASLTRELIEKWFLVPEDFDDMKFVRQTRNVMKLLHPAKHITSYTVLPTTGCNARCFYCYESNMRRVTMTPEIADEAAHFIKENCGGEKVRLSWFGGEPLLGATQIRGITKGLAAEGIAFDSTMITNGYLFTPEVVKEATTDWHLKRVQITLDGTEDVYNRTKAYMGLTEPSPYRRVLGNIALLINAGVQVNIRMNLGEHNYADLDSLIDELYRTFGAPDNLCLYVHELFEGVGYEAVSYDDGTYDGLHLRIADLSKKIRDLGYKAKEKKSDKGLKLCRCMADSDRSIIIAPDGTLSKCEHYVFEHTVGTLADGITSRENMAAWKETSDTELCNGCPLYPHCVNLKLCDTSRPCDMLTRGQRIDACRRNMHKTAQKY